MLDYEHSFFPRIVPMSRQEQLDELLVQYLQQAIAPDADSEERTKAADSLFYLAEQLPNVLTQERLDAGLRLYYDEALSRTRRSIARNIQNFPVIYNLDINSADTETVRQQFVKWFNLILRRKAIEIWRARKNRPKPVELDSPFGEDGETTRGDVTPDTSKPEPLEATIQEEQRRNLQKAIAYLDSDPDEELLRCASRKYPACNCRAIYRMRRQEPPKTWQEIAKALGVDYGTVTAHWHKRGKPLIREITQRFGYEPEE